MQCNEFQHLFCIPIKNFFLAGMINVEKPIDYLKWRGDLQFSNDPFNDIDALILALFSYLPFKDIIPDINSKDEVTLKTAASTFFAHKPENEIQPSSISPTISTSFNSDLLELFQLAANSPRFEDIRLSKYDENTDFIIGRQFAALTYTIKNKTTENIVAFRGTDNSLIGWKEDFELAYMEQTPAQQAAANYLANAIGIFSGKVTVCGHSKGGNLAVYAASHLRNLLQRKVKKIINFDGPGFDFTVIDRAYFQSCENKVINYIPEESMIGMLLEPVGQRTVIASSSRYINQHIALNWHVIRTNFIDGKLSDDAVLLQDILIKWLNDISLSEREIFLEALFDILGASEGTSLTFNPQENLQDIRNILIKYSKLDTKTKELLTQVFNALTNQTKKTISTTIREKFDNLI
jgi:pimeloyl-ACP methyl ester carboxylesterase